MLPSEIREVKELIAVEDSSDTNNLNEETIDYYRNPEKRILILERDNYKCNYCLKDLNKDNFYLDHIFPCSQGGHNYRSNLLAACHSCNTKKNNNDVDEFLMSNYRSGLLTQNEFLHQRAKIHSLIDVYNEAVESE